MSIHEGALINDEWIESLIVDIQIEANQDFQHTEFSCKQYSANGDESGEFWEALQNASQYKFAMWEIEREHSDVWSHTEDDFRRALTEGGFLKRWEHDDPLTCAYPESFEPVLITSTNYRAVLQCFTDAAHTQTWRISESLQSYLLGKVMD